MWDFLKKNWTYVLIFLVGILVSRIASRMIMTLVIVIVLAAIFIIAYYVRKKKEKKNENDTPVIDSDN